MRQPISVSRPPTRPIGWWAAGARRLAWTGALTLLVAGARTSAACATCGCGDSTLTAAGLEKPYRNRVRVALEERFGAHAAGLGPAASETSTLRSTLQAMWSPLDRLTVAAALPLVANWISQPGRPVRGLVGLGDAELSARVVVWRNRGFSPSHLVSLLGGLKMPTGPRLHDAGGFPFAADDQPGSGSWDPFAGVSWGWFGRKASTYASIGGRLTTRGYRDYQRGPQLGASAGAQYQPIDRLALGLAVDYRYASADSQPTVDAGGTSRRIDAPDSGGASLALTPSVMVAILEPWLLRAAVQVHVWDDWNGHQSESYALILATVVDLN